MNTYRISYFTDDMCWQRTVTAKSWTSALYRLIVQVPNVKDAEVELLSGEDTYMADKTTTTTTQQPKPAPQPPTTEHPAGEQVPQSPGSTPTREPAGTPARQA